MVYTIRLTKQLKSVLKGFRKSKGLSQSDVAQKLGITQQAYQLIESNPEKVSVERLFKVLTILGVVIQLSEKTSNLNLKQRHLKQKRLLALKAKAKTKSMQY